MSLKHKTFEELDAATGFSAKAGFKLAPIQIEDINRAAKWDRMGNYYEVGGGKTVIATALCLMADRDYNLIVAPPILITPWVRWLAKFSDSVGRYQGTPAARRAVGLYGHKWLVMSHAIFRKIHLDFIKGLNGATVQIVIDEAHAAKNSDSKLYHAIMNVAELKNSRTQLLTGTPISSPLDAYAYIAFKSPGIYNSRMHFEAAHVAERELRFDKPRIWIGLDRIKELFSLRTLIRTKKEIHGYDNSPLYPDCAYTLDDEHYKLYKRLVAERLLELPDGAKIDATTVQRLYHSLQQIVVNYDYFSGNPKARAAIFDMIDLTIEEIGCLQPENSKLIIWTHYKRTSASVLQYFLNKGIKAVAAYSEANTEKSIEDFMHDPATRILVAQPSSCGAGLNPQGVCSEELFIEFSTTRLLIRQAIGRVDRVGQTRKPRIKFAVAQGTLQVALLGNLLSNDDLVLRVEGGKQGLRNLLLGGK